MKKILFLLFTLLTILTTTVTAFENMRSLPTSGHIIYSAKIGRATTSHSFQNIELEEIASNFDIFSCFPEHFGPRINDLKAMNPDLIALLYRNYRAVYLGTDEYRTALNNGWLLRDRAGTIVRSTQWYNNIMVDIGNPNYQNFIVNWIKENIIRYGFDGVWFDNGFAVRNDEIWFGLTADPINPRTGKGWTGEEIKQACIQVHNKLKNAIGSKLDVPNAIFNGHRFWTRFDDYMDLLDNTSVDGLMSEGMWFAYNGRWFTVQEWLESLNFSVWIQNYFLTPRKVFWMQCEVVTVGRLPSGCTYYQMIDYAFSSSLLGLKGVNNYIEFFESYNRGSFFLNNYVEVRHNLVLGEPLNDYYKIEGTLVYSRDFTNVKVLVNPTFDSYTINLGQFFKTLEGEEISVIELDPHTGVVLKVIN